jgi:ankyrin repeat protein
MGSSASSPPPPTSQQHIRQQLFEAAIQGNEAQVKQLALQRADVNAVFGDYQITPLHMASNNGHQSVVDTLISHAANVNQGNRDGITPLYEACRYGHQLLAMQLIDHRADINVHNVYPITYQATLVTGHWR